MIPICSFINIFGYQMRNVWCLLKQEMLTFFRMMDDGSLTARASKRLTNVLTLFQAIELDFFILIIKKTLSNFHPGFSICSSSHYFFLLLFNIELMVK